MTTLPEPLLRLADYFAFYQREHTHQALGFPTRHQVYRYGHGGPPIADHFNDCEPSRPQLQNAPPAMPPARH